MILYCLKGREKKKKKKAKTLGLQKQIKENQCLYQNMKSVIVKNHDLS